MSTGACAPVTVATAKTIAAPRAVSRTALADDGIFLEVVHWTRLHRHRLWIELQRQLEIRRVIARERHRIDTRVARRAVAGSPARHGAGEPVQAQIGDAVGVEILTDFLERVRRRDQFR